MIKTKRNTFCECYWFLLTVDWVAVYANALLIYLLSFFFRFLFGLCDVFCLCLKMNNNKDKHQNWFGPNQIWLFFTLIFVYFSLVSRFFRVIRFLCFEMSSFSFVFAPMHFKSESNLLYILYMFCNLKGLKMYKNAFGFIHLVHPKWRHTI